MAESDRERWNRKYEGHAGRSAAPSAALVALDAWLPHSGRALDLAGGAGANAMWLGQRGLDVTLVDCGRVKLAPVKDAFVQVAPAPQPRSPEASDLSVVPPGALRLRGRCGSPTAAT